MILVPAINAWMIWKSHYFNECVKISRVNASQRGQQIQSNARHKYKLRCQEMMSMMIPITITTKILSVTGEKDNGRNDGWRWHTSKYYGSFTLTKSISPWDHKSASIFYELMKFHMCLSLSQVLSLIPVLSLVSHFHPILYHLLMFLSDVRL